MKKIFLLLILVVSFSMTECRKPMCKDMLNGIIVKKSIDGCTWLIQLEDNSLLEPTNLNSFKVTIKDGQEVRLSYAENKSAASICMMGKIVDLKYIADR